MGGQEEVGFAYDMDEYFELLENHPDWETLRRIDFSQRYLGNEFTEFEAKIAKYCFQDRTSVYPIYRQKACSKEAAILT
jgi:hypothetical protein